MATRKQSGFLVQSTHGAKGNFEMVVPPSDGQGLVHFWRNNDVGGFPWNGPYCFGSGSVDAVSLIQSNFGSRGNLEVVVREGERLAAYWRMDHSPWTWHGPYYFADGVRVKGDPSLIQSNHGRKGNFELVVPLVDGGLAHFWRNNDAGGFPWRGPYPFGSGTVGATSLIQSNFGSKGNLEVVAREGERLAAYWRLDHNPWTWHGPDYIDWPHWRRLSFAMQHQQQTQWCWAAVAANVSAFFDSNTSWTQCTIVNAELDRSDCCSHGSSANCNRPWYLDRALSRTGNLQTWSTGARALTDVIDEVNAERPLCARIGWSGGGGHFLAIDGYNCELAMVAVDDPWYGASDVTLSTFQTAYQGTGSWTHTYWVQS